MKEIGKITQFNGRYGIIMDQQDEVEFCIQDVLYFEVSVGDIVFFRKEWREPDLFLARYICLYQRKRKEE